MPITYRIDTERGLVLTTADFAFGTARMYQTMTDEQPAHVQVFRDMAEARAWLGLPPDGGP